MQNNEPKIPQCFVCHTTFNDFKALARHIVENKKTHHKSLKWASKVLTNVEYLNKKQDFSGRSTLTEEERESKKECVRELSGIRETAMCLCPHCNARYPTKVEIEHIKNPTAWRKNKYLMLLCLTCRK